MVLNSQERKALTASPYSLIFGSDTSPRLLPNQLLTSLTSHPLPADKPEFIEHLQNLTEKLISSWEAVSQPPINLLLICPSSLIVLKSTIVFLFCARSQTNSTATFSPLVLNPVTGFSPKTAIYLVKPYPSFLPLEILNAYVAADSGELILDAIIDVSGDSVTVLWSDGTTTIQSTDSIRNTAAYSKYIKLSADPPKSH
ncbi:hypothetical protein P9112_013902 [Eukaryota sp. TZLM1-RC]